MNLPKKTDNYTLIDEGIYRMRFDSYEEPTPSTFDPDKMMVKLIFAIEDPTSEFHGEMLHQFFGWTMHPRGRLYPVIKALNSGLDIEDDEEIDLDDLKGRALMGTVTHTTKNRDGQEQTYANLTGAVPVRKKKVEAAAPAKAPKPPVDEDDGDELFGDTEDAA